MTRRLPPRRLAAAAVAVLAAAAVAVATPARAAPAGLGNVSWLAAGDSYSSGEGIAGTGAGTDTCAQSTLAYGPKSAEILRGQRGWTVTPLAFTACTGATLHEFYGGGGGSNNGHGPQWEQALRKQPAGKRFDVVTMSFGGNDIDFASTLQGCLDAPVLADTWTDIVLKEPVGDAPCDVTYDTVRKRIDALLAGDSFTKPGTGFGTAGKLSLAEFYAQVANQTLTKRGTLVVVGYPRLFAPANEWGAWRNGRCNLMQAADTQMLGRAAEYLDNALRQAVEQARGRVTNGTVDYVSRFDLFHQNGESHELCSGRTEYLNGMSVGFRDGSLRVMHAFHPNEIGHQVTAEYVAGRVAYTLDPPPAPSAPASNTAAAAARPSASPIGDGTSHWNVGDAFRSHCVVAWPTAPVRTTQYIQMRMSCQGVPQQFLFVDVVYPDPKLNVTPSTGSMLVEGKIADLTQSEYGFRTVVVQASRIVLP
ncbi:SGNH/GDSL hydrolase family protein [Dactylosporangium sp. NPDC050588]|uniref:SGNH/GDSL hydrolase family protein n=1 Tax=Dactylosporangium sp. NPDC050588 TaxID=3157211 RepID=UPI0033EF64E0